MNKNPYIEPRPFFGQGYKIPEGVDGSEFNTRIYFYPQTLTKPENKEALDKLLAYAAHCDTINETTYDSLLQAYRAYHTLYVNTFAPNKKDDKKILAAFDLIVPVKPIKWVLLITNTVLHYQREEARQQQEADALAKKKAADGERQRKVASATAYVMQRAYNIDFAANEVRSKEDNVVVGSVSNIVDFANCLAREEKIAEYQDGEEIDIDCCDDCSIWIKGERRCSCGNRRIYWESTGDFEDMIVYPAAD